jgi:hypothetical protein
MAKGDISVSDCSETNNGRQTALNFKKKEMLYRTNMAHLFPTAAEHSKIQK